MDSLNGKNFENVKLDSEQINTFEHYFKNFRLKNETSLKELEIIKIPSFDDKVDIVFDDNSEYENLHLKIYTAIPAHNEKHFKISIYNFIVTYKIILDNTKNTLNFGVTIEPGEIISSVSSALKFFEIFEKTISGQNFTVYKRNKIIYKNVDGPKIKITKKGSDRLQEYFINLRKIEKHFEKHFRSINISDADDELVSYILAFINKEDVKQDFNQIKAPIENKDNLDDLIQKSKKDNGLLFFLLQASDPFILNLHGLNFNIGFCRQLIKDGYIENIEDLENGVTKNAIIKSKSNTQHLQFLEKTSD